MSHFNLVANSWDTPEKIKLSEHYADRIRFQLKGLGPRKILEVGCGTGLLGANFLNEKTTLIGVDTSRGMLDVFNEKFKGLKARSELKDLEMEDLDEYNFDLIISSMAFHHLKNPAALISKLKKHLAPNGVIAVIDLDAEDGTFHPDPVNMGVFHSGFSDITTKSWSQQADFKNYSREIVHKIEKNEKHYPLFLAMYFN